MKSRILEHLRRAGGPVSGEDLAGELGVSRVAVWKHVQSLIERGYAIESSGVGYALTRECDFLYSWEFPRRQDRVHHFETLGSTMDEARKLARQGAPPMSVVIAEKQEAGRGRLSRSWISKAGGLYFTLILRPELPVLLAWRVLFDASVVLTRILRERAGVEAAVKWPNDILVGERKLVGILSEMAAEGDTLEYVNLGIGVNVNNRPSEEEPGAVSLGELTGKEFSRKEILAEFLDVLEARSGNLADPAILDEWRALSATLGKEVRVDTLRQTLTGLALDLDETGALMVRDASGEIHRITCGDCLHQRHSGMV